MQLIYQGKDITNDVKVLQADIRDTAGGEADSVDILLSDTDKLWREWFPEKGDILEVKQDGFSSGAMFVDYISPIRGMFVLKSRSTPLDAKTERTRTWENVRFLQVATDISGNYGFTLSTHNITNWLYDRLDQVEIPDFRFLAGQCMQEGYCLKVQNRKVIIYDEQTLEKSKPVRTITPQDFVGDYAFYSISDGLFSGCLVRYLDSTGSLISYSFSPSGAPKGPVLKPKLRAVNLAEAQRYAQGALRYRNKWEIYGDFHLTLDTGIAAGNTLMLDGMGGFNGRYFIDSCIHQLMANKSRLRIRKVLEGY